MLVGDVVVVVAVVFVVAWRGFGIRRKSRHLFLLSGGCGDCCYFCGDCCGCSVLCSGSGGGVLVFFGLCLFLFLLTLLLPSVLPLGVVVVLLLLLLMLLLLLLLLMLLLLLAEHFASCEVAWRSKRVAPCPLVGSRSKEKLEALRSLSDAPETKRPAAIATTVNLTTPPNNSKSYKQQHSYFVLELV